MKRSTDRILTTHMGSLPRPDMLADLLVAQAEGKPVDAARIPALTDEAMDLIVRRQLDCGIDVGNDGEMPRSTFFGYITGRMSGFGGQSKRRPILDMQHFPKWWQNYQARGVRRLNVYGFPAAIGPVRYESLDGAKAELDAFARALKRQTKRFAETFVTAVSPGFAACSLQNQHYDSHEAYVFALARELRQEYQFIVAQGHVLQIDLPDLGIERAGYFQDEPLPKFIEAMEMHVAALNEALADIPPERVRFHACWGNRDSPHVNDVPAPDVLPVCYQVKAGALCLPFANPRHSHEVDAFRTQKLPDRMTLVCGVVEIDAQLRRAPAGDRRAAGARRARRRRPRARHGRHRLRLRHHRRRHPGVRGRGVGQARGDARRCGHRQQAALGLRRTRRRLTANSLGPDRCDRPVLGGFGKQRRRFRFVVAEPGLLHEVVDPRSIGAELEGDDDIGILVVGAVEVGQLHCSLRDVVTGVLLPDGLEFVALAGTRLVPDIESGSCRAVRHGVLRMNVRCVTPLGDATVSTL